MNDAYFTLERRGRTGVVWLDQQGSKVNTIGPAMIAAFGPLLEAIEADPEIDAVVLMSRKKDFIAGADIEAFATVRAVGDWRPIGNAGHAILDRIERSRKPFVAAIHGACLGAGLEIALACAARVAADEGTVLALPEVKLGLLPGGGGTQRLPRLVGLEKALDMMLTGKNIHPHPARKMGLVDRLATRPALLDAAIHLAGEIRDRRLRRADPRPLVSRLLAATPLTRGIIFRKAKETVARQTRGNYPAPDEIIECVRTGTERGMAAGLAEEVTRFEKLILTPESQQLRGIFFATTEKKKNPLADQVRPVTTIGMLGAGFMGAGIAEVSVAKGMRVLLKDVRPETIARAKQTIWESVDAKRRRRAVTPLEADLMMNRIVGQLDYAHFDRAELVIEAIFEDLAVKQRVLAECEPHLQEGAIFASNTSALPITEIASASRRPEQVIGMHYFSPVPKMPLLELVVTDRTAPWVVATCYDVGVRQGKTVIVVKDGPGFYTTRILVPMMGEALNLLDEGADVLQIDRVIRRFGFPVGPVTLIDEVGIDVGVHIMTGRLMERLVEAREGVRVSPGLGRMHADGYHGRKNGKGFYRYGPGGERLRDQVDPRISSYFGGGARRTFDDREIVDRVVLSMVGEAARCLDEGIIASPLDGDVGAVFGLGFPPFRGGPFRFMDAEGAAAVVEQFTRLADRHGPRFAPPQVLVDQARRGGRWYADT
jgi:3-hydroxyacyl-CoA dehydrogenase/enoyl-CoA hydratase/3-hydroxybutyryl-CoA epimerase